MARKPIPGSDGNNWGSVLNDYLDTLSPGPGEVIVGGADGPVAVGRGEPVAHADFRGKPNGAITALDSGQPWHLIHGTDESRMRVVGGAITTATTTGKTAGYAEVELPGPIKRMGATVRFSPYTVINGSATLAIWQTEHPSVDFVPNSPMHMQFRPDGISVGVWTSGSGGETSIGARTFLTPLVADGVTEHTVEATIDGDTLTVWVSNGETLTLKDARISQYAGPWACWETYASDVTTMTRAAFVEVWADTTAPKQRAGTILRDVDTVATEAAKRLQPIIRQAAPTSAANITLSSTYQELSQDLRVRLRVPPSGQILFEGWFYLDVTTANVLIGVAWDDAFTQLTMNSPIINDSHKGVVSISRILTPTAGTVGTLRVGARASAGTGVVRIDRGAGYVAVVKITPL